MSTTTVGTPPIQPQSHAHVLRLRRGQVVGGFLLIALLLVMIIAAVGPFPWSLLGQGILLLVAALMVLLVVGALLITLSIVAITRKQTHIQLWLKRLLRLCLVLMIVLVTLGGAVLGSQLHATTPPILGADGQPLSGSISTMEQVTLNGSPQWITIRGKNVHHPVLLFLMGGPGAGGFPDNSFYLTPLGLEDHFVVVNWDQPGTGKSRNAVPRAQLTPQRYVADAYALTQMLRVRFHQDKIYVYGSSWEPFSASSSCSNTPISSLPILDMDRWSIQLRTIAWAISSPSHMPHDMAIRPPSQRCIGTGHLLTREMDSSALCVL